MSTLLEPKKRRHEDEFPSRVLAIFDSEITLIDFDLRNGPVKDAGWLGDSVLR